MKANYMLDIETTGVRPGCCILQIAVVPMEPTPNPTPFSIYVSPQSCLDIGLTYDSRTVDWWETQDPEIRERVWGGKAEIADALVLLNSYFQERYYDPIIWCKGADFDVPILAAAYAKVGMATPWKYNNVRCYRTLSELFYLHKEERGPAKHDALNDATMQARNASNILLSIGSNQGRLFT